MEAMHQESPGISLLQTCLSDELEKCIRPIQAIQSFFWALLMLREYIRGQQCDN